jgi:hypothetical protein
MLGRNAVVVISQNRLDRWVDMGVVAMNDGKSQREILLMLILVFNTQQRSLGTTPTVGSSQGFQLAG